MAEKLYKVVGQAVEIGGIKREVGQKLGSSCFNPAPTLTEEEIADGREAVSELDSLIASGHVVETTETE